MVEISCMNHADIFLNFFVVSSRSFVVSSRSIIVRPALESSWSNRRWVIEGKGPSRAKPSKTATLDR